MIIFETERLIVRQFTDKDAENFFSLSGDIEVMRYIRPVSDREASDRFLRENISAYQKSPHRGRWAVVEKDSERFLGSFAIIPLPSDAAKIQLGYSLTPQNWGRGYATELTKKGLAFFFEKDTLPLIHGVTEIPNVASQRVLLKAGFMSAGTFFEEGKELLLFTCERKDFLKAASSR